MLGIYYSTTSINVQTYFTIKELVDRITGHTPTLAKIFKLNMLKDDKTFNTLYREEATKQLLDLEVCKYIYAGTSKTYCPMVTPTELISKPEAKYTINLNVPKNSIKITSKERSWLDFKSKQKWKLYVGN